MCLTRSMKEFDGFGIRNNSTIIPIREHTCESKYGVGQSGVERVGDKPIGESSVCSSSDFAFEQYSG